MSSQREVIYETLEVYDEISRGYSSWRNRAWDVVKVLRGGVVLDLGSGNCVNGVHLALEREVDHLICIDIAPSMLLEARNLVTRKKLSKADFVAADATAIPLRDLAVDSVISIALAHHLPTTELRKAFIEIARILKPKGLVLVTSWSRRQPRFVTQTFILYIKKLLGFPGSSVYKVKWRTRRRVYMRKYFLYEVNDLERAAREAGLEIVSSGYIKQFKNLNSLIVAAKQAPRSYLTLSKVSLQTYTARRAL